MNLVRLAAGCCALLLLTACGAGTVSNAAQDRLAMTARPTGSSIADSAPGGQPQVTDDGVTITVSAPKPFTPTDAAYPHAPRAVAFDLVIDNKGTDVYRPSQLSVTAICNGAIALQVIDSTQGYTGLMSVTEEVAPGHDAQVAVAFALPVERATLRLLVQPNTPDGKQVTVFDGTV